jgi:hypothetical protein
MSASLYKANLLPDMITVVFFLARRAVVCDA